MKPKYTSGGLIYKNSTDSKGKGWQDDGILRYNALFKFVEQDRANNELFMNRYLENKRQREEVFVQRSKPTPRPRVLPRCDLGLNLGMSKLAVSPEEKSIEEDLPNGAASGTDESDVDGGYGTEDEDVMDEEN